MLGDQNLELRKQYLWRRWESLIETKKPAEKSRKKDPANCFRWRSFSSPLFSYIFFYLYVVLWILYSKMMVLELKVWAWRVEKLLLPPIFSSGQSDRWILGTLGEHGMYHKWFLIAHAIVSCSKIHFIYGDKSPVTHILQTIDFRIGLTIFLPWTIQKWGTNTMKLHTFIPELMFTNKDNAHLATRPAEKVNNNIINHNCPIRLSFLFLWIKANYPFELFIVNATKLATSETTIWFLYYIIIVE